MRIRTGCIAAVVALLAAAEARAIPAFARKYKTSCNTCHVAIPKLNDFGEAFRLNGFKIAPDDEILVKDEPVPMGAAALRGEWPQSILPSSIPGLPPISAWVQWGFTQNDGDATKVNFGTPNLIWMIGANLGSQMSFFLEQGPKQRAYFKIDDFLNNPIFGDWFPKRLLDLRAGLLEPEIMAFSDARRLPITNHLMYTFDSVGSNGNGNPFKIDRQVAVEFMGIFARRFRYVLGLTNGSNDGSDNNSRKDFYGRIAGKVFGGMAFTGHEEVKESLDVKENWTDNSVTVGAWGYLGSNTVVNALVAGSTYTVDFYRFGFDIRGNWKHCDLVVAAGWGQDDNAVNDGADLGHFTGLIELDYVVLPWLVAYGKFEWLAFRGPSSSLVDSKEARRIVIGATASVYANFRMTAEVKLDEDLHDIDRPEAFLFRMDIDF